MLKCSYITIGYWPISTLDSNSLIIKHHQEGELLCSYIVMPWWISECEPIAKSVSLARPYLGEWHFHLADWQLSYIALMLLIAGYFIVIIYKLRDHWAIIMFVAICHHAAIVVISSFLLVMLYCSIHQLAFVTHLAAMFNLQWQKLSIHV